MPNISKKLGLIRTVTRPYKFEVITTKHYDVADGQRRTIDGRPTKVIASAYHSTPNVVYKAYSKIRDRYGKVTSNYNSGQEMFAAVTHCSKVWKEYREQQTEDRESFFESLV
jgi:hypothetical protein